MAEGFGRVPVWGFATVEDAGDTSLSAGERVYGYWPMSTHLVARPDRATAMGFVDAAAHRQGLPPVYNSYSRLGADAADPTAQAHRAILQPLFTTGFVIDDFLADNSDFGASVVYLASASSKTALGTAACLKARGALKVVGLTSPRNEAFVRGTGYFDDVLTYEAVDALDPAARAVYVDMAGDSALRARVHARLRDALAYSCAVGATHWEAMKGAGPDLPGPKPVQFFAPDQIRKRHKDWGAQAYAAKLDAAWDAFAGSAGRWMTVREAKGADAVVALWRDALDGRLSPSDGWMAEI